MLNSAAEKQFDNCENCVPCMRLKLMEFGFIAGQDIEIQKKQWGLYVVNMISKLFFKIFFRFINKYILKNLIISFK